MEKEYCISFPVCLQVGPDDWQVSHPSMKVTPQTTVAEIAFFFKKYCQNAPLEIKLIELQTP